ncbi:MAG TPA: hypothetical protein VF820_01175, partial [Patescibacteria group bacterium]
MVKRILLTFLSLLIFSVTSFVLVNKTYACDMYTANYGAPDGSAKHVLCGKDKDGNTNIGICVFGVLGCGPTILPGMQDITIISGDTVGKECSDKVPWGNGADWKCEVPLATNGQFCLKPESDFNNLGTLTGGSFSDNSSFCSNNQICYMNPSTNTPGCACKDKTSCASDPATGLSNAVCLHPGNSGDSWNDSIQIDGAQAAYRTYEGGGYACYNDCNGVYTSNPSKACPGGQGGQGGINNNIQPISQLTISPYPLPCPTGSFSLGTCTQFSTAVGTINTDVGSFVGQFLGILLGLSGGIAVAVIIFS